MKFKKNWLYSKTGGPYSKNFHYRERLQREKDFGGFYLHLSCARIKSRR